MLNRLESAVLESASFKFTHLSIFRDLVTREYSLFDDLQEIGWLVASALTLSFVGCLSLVMPHFLSEPLILIFEMGVIIPFSQN